MHQGELYASKSPVYTIKQRVRDITFHVLELLSLVCNGLPCVHGLHAQHLIIALFIIEHGGGKVLEHVLGRKRSIGLRLE